ncbi:alpha/beta fold hydrolase [Nonomuraea sp. MTCD27]|uniref:alpha/beta fold hydrolase n=1 Tax=Nonomuraea sp. MTCD27 TaxID=1676747 RepID=UPI0035BF3AF3
MTPQGPPAHSREIAGRVARACLAVSERSGHFPYLEERDAFEDVLAGWVRDHGLG